LNRRAFLASAAALSAASACPSIYSLHTGSAQNDERNLQTRFNSVIWDQDRWKPWVISLAADGFMTGADYPIDGGFLKLR
jgi:hypothetical protein